MGTLNLIQQMLLREHPVLESNILSSSEALHVWRNKSDRKGLRYLPNFHLIFQVHQDENLTVKLMTFHGKTVDSRAFKHHDQDLPEHVRLFIDRYSSGLKLCQVCNNLQNNLKVESPKVVIFDYSNIYLFEKVSRIFSLLSGYF